MSDPKINPHVWKFPLGAVVTWAPSFRDRRREVGHVVRFAQDQNDLVMVMVRWQDGRTEDVPPGYLATERDMR